MKRFLYTLSALLVFTGIANAGYDLVTKSFPDPDYPSRTYSVELEATAGDVLNTDYLAIYRTATKTTELIDATLVYGFGAAKAGEFTTITATGDLSGDGADQLFGFRQDQVASTTGAITAAQAGKTFVSNSADVMTLPEASTVLGARYTFVCGTADDFDINPADGTDVIGPVSTTNGTTGVVTLAPAAGDAIRCTDIGGSITLEAIGDDRWAQVAGGNGVWTDVN
jgi:hypothetical protein